MKLRISYNSPLILTYSIVAVAVFSINYFFNDVLYNSFSLASNVSFLNPLTYPRLLSYALGHNSMTHLAGNLSLLLLIGPVVEEKYGSKRLLVMMMFTAATTGLLNLLVFDTGIIGASGVVFMMIVLSSFTNVEDGEIPLTFIFVILIYLGAEIYNAIFQDNVSQFAHIVGGICGGWFGFSKVRKNLDV